MVSGGSRPVWQFDGRFGWRLGGGANGGGYVNLGSPTPNLFRVPYVTIIGACQFSQWGALLSTAYSPNTTHSTGDRLRHRQWRERNGDYYGFMLACSGGGTDWANSCAYFSVNQFNGSGHGATLVARYGGGVASLRAYDMFYGSDWGAVASHRRAAVRSFTTRTTRA